MFSFMKIATFAALTFGTLTSAIPSPVAAPEARADVLVEKRTAADVSGVLSNLHHDLSVPCGKLSGLTSAEVTVEIVTEIVGEIVSLVNTAVSDCHGLPVGSGNLTLILVAILNLVFGACGLVYNLAGVDQVALKVVFAVLDSCIGALIKLVLGLVTGILGLVLSVVLGLLGSLLTCGSIILQLQLSLCIALLGL